MSAPARSGFSASIAAFDDAAEQFIEARRSPALDRFFYPLSSAADHSLGWHALGVLRALPRGDVEGAAHFSLAMGFESVATNVVAKSLFGRLRPQQALDDPLPYGLHRPITSSFPSGHAAAAFCAATLLGDGRRSAPLWYSLAALVGVSRVYVRLHHASDVVAGAALGLALGRMLRR